MTSKSQRHLILILIGLLLANASFYSCGENSSPKDSKPQGLNLEDSLLGGAQASARALSIVDEKRAISERVALISALEDPSESGIVEALLLVMKDKSQQAFVMHPLEQPIGGLHYRVEESPYGGLDTRAELRWTAVIALERLKVKAALPDLISGLYDRCPVVRNHAARALWQLGNTQGVPVLLKALEGKALENETANAILQEISGKDAKFDTDIGYRLKSEAAQRWHKIFADPAMKPTTTPLQLGDDAHLDRRCQMLVGIMGQFQFLFMEQSRRALANMGELGVQHLRVAFADPVLGVNPQVQAYGVEVLRMIGSKTSVEFLRELLAHVRPVVRSRAAKALGILGDRESTAKLLALLKDKDSSVVIAALEAIGRTDDPKDPLSVGESQAIFDQASDSSRLKLVAACTLLKMGRKTAAGPFVMTYLESTAPHKRAEIAEFLEEWHGDLLGFDPRAELDTQGAALKAWRQILLQP